MDERAHLGARVGVEEEQRPVDQRAGCLALRLAAATGLVPEDEHLTVPGEAGRVPDGHAWDDLRVLDDRVHEGAAVGGIEAPDGEAVTAGAGHLHGIAEDHAGVVAGAVRDLREWCGPDPAGGGQAPLYRGAPGPR